MINNRFTIQNLIGEGRSKVFLCNDYFLGEKQFAIKILDSNEKSEIEAFRHEFDLLSNFDHPFIIKAFEFGQILELDDETKKFDIKPNSYFIILEYFEGFELQNFPGYKKEKIFTEIIRQISIVLYHLHQSNYIHFDVKPENFLCNYNSDGLSIKMIDFGFTRYARVDDEIEIKGTPEYIAPEIIEQNYVDYRADLYSFGMLIYKLIYGLFPFKNPKEVHIYKQTLVGNFDFPNSNVHPKFINICKKLLSLNPLDRPFTSLNILSEIGIVISNDELNLTYPLLEKIDRKTVNFAVESYLNNKEIGEILMVKGEKGIGKSTIFQEISDLRENCILIGQRSSNEIPVIKNLAYQLLYKIKITDHDFVESLKTVIKTDVIENISILKKVFKYIAENIDAIYIFDDFQSFDRVSRELFVELINLLQINSRKIIISENECDDSIVGIFKNVLTLNVTSLTQGEVKEMISRSYFSFFPSDDLTRIILDYCSLSPSEIKRFIKNLLVLGIISFKQNALKLFTSKSKLKALEKIQENFLENIQKNITEDEMLIAQYLSIFNCNIDESLFVHFVGYSESLIHKVIDSLRNKGVILSAKDSIAPQFSSKLIKDYFYKQIENKKSVHFTAGRILSQTELNIDQKEIARHFSIAGDVNSAEEVLLGFIETLPEGFALGQKIEICKNILELDLSDSKRNINLLRLAKYQAESGDYENCKSICQNLVDSFNTSEVKILFAESMIKTGEVEKGIKYIEPLLDNVKAEDKNKVELLIAGGEIDLNKFSSARKRLESVSKSGFREFVASSFNLLALIEIYEKNNFAKAAGYFRKSIDTYTELHNISRVISIRLNLGNIYSMQGKIDKALAQWEKCEEENLEINNLELSAKLLLNYGIHEFEKCEYENAVDNYKKAFGTFIALGDKDSEGLVQINLGEIFIEMCEYQNALDALENAINIFMFSKNFQALLDAYYNQIKLFYELGFVDGIEKVVGQINNICNNNSVKLRADKQAHIELMKSNFDGDLKEFIAQLKSIYRTASFLNDEESKQIKLKMLEILFEKTYEAGDYHYCLNLITSHEIKNLIEGNAFREAQIQLFLGKLHGKVTSNSINTAIAHFQNSYRLVEKASITKITYQILFELADYFISRGKLKEAKMYSNYCKHILGMIVEQFKESKIADAFQNKSEILKMNQKIKLIEEE